MSESSATGGLRPTRRGLVNAAVLGIVTAPLAYVAGRAEHAELPITQLDLDPMAWARKMPPTPSFPAQIDAYARYDPQTVCSPSAKP
ncbi:MAG TPA: hypothetical protein VE287_03900, partial [Actinopolymorphaceae bacterium]|nr:hypothetical protein [Actinopolymorphaceae bacterium]